jgi:hypothetical protein
LFYDRMIETGGKEIRAIKRTLTVSRWEERCAECESESEGFVFRKRCPPIKKVKKGE